MVKGISRRVIVVPQPDRRLFEQAIFIVKEDAFGDRGVSAQQVLDEAARAAEGYVKRTALRPVAPWMWAALGAVAGAVAASGGWALALLL